MQGMESGRVSESVARQLNEVEQNVSIWSLVMFDD